MVFIFLVLVILSSNTQKKQLELNMDKYKSIRARTKDGLVVRLETKILYTLETNIDSLATLYLMFKEDYQVAIENICRSVIRDVTSDFTAYQFWSERSKITTTMENELANRLDDIFVQLKTFLLGNYELPRTFQTIIDTTEVQRQELNKVKYEFDRVAEETKGMKLKADEEVIQIRKKGNATIQQINLEAEADAFRILTSVTNEITGYKAIKQALQLTSQELAAFVWLERMRESNSSKTISVKTPSEMAL